jgi:hypothetical protein
MAPKIPLAITAPSTDSVDCHREEADLGVRPTIYVQDILSAQLDLQQGISPASGMFRKPLLDKAKRMSYKRTVRRDQITTRIAASRANRGSGETPPDA